MATSKMRQSKKHGSSKKADSKGKDAIEKAKKAVAKAQKAVSAAQRAVKSSNKKLRRKTEALAEQARQLSSTLSQTRASREAMAIVSSASSAQKAANVGVSNSGDKTGTTEPVLFISAAPAQAAVSSASGSTAGADLTPPLPSAQPAAPTLVELRQRARDQKIPGYSRMKKADLVAALDRADQA